MSAPEPEFDTIQEAEQTFYGSSTSSGSEDSGDDSTGSTRWGDLETEPTEWEAGWTLAFQEELATATDGSTPARRWFVFRVNPDTGAFEAMTETGQADEYAEDSSLDELPNMGSESLAREAYKTWLSEAETTSSEDEEQSGDWGEWAKVGKSSDWTIFGREHQSREETQFLAASTLEDGTAVYLQPSGEVGESPHIYESRGAVQEAVDAYVSRVEAGDTDRQPTGNAPSKPTIRKDTAGKSRAGGPLDQLTNAVGGTPTILIAVVGLVALYYAEKQGYIDVTEAI